MKMNTLKALSTAAAICLSCPPAQAASPASQGEESAQPWKTIDIQGLEALLSSKDSFKIVDARSDKYFNGKLIPGAQRLPAESSEDEIQSVLPNKSELVVVYCGGAMCPASQTLAQRLVDMGYTNVVDYHGGIQEWVANNKPVQSL
jgi:rhodanese-related sulfurtransferase